ncbi:MAG: AAA family ATPase [Planctomycetota bacterium]
MYEAYWQLDSKPFAAAAAQGGAAFFAGQTHTGAQLKLRYAIEQRSAAAVLAGPAGVGKTLLVRRTLAELDPRSTPVAWVVFPQMSHRDLLAYLANRLGAPAPEQATAAAHPNATAQHAATQYTVDESILRLEHLFAGHQAAGRHAVLVIDEAHLLEDTGLLETIRLLLNLGPDGRPTVTLLLVGQMGLLSALGRTPALEERVAVKSLLRPLSVDETGEYIRCRMEAAGAAREVFTGDAVEMMHALTGGVPRRIDRLGDLALVVGFADGRPTIDDDHVESVSRELLSIAPE